MNNLLGVVNGIATVVDDLDIEFDEKGLTEKIAVAVQNTTATAIQKDIAGTVEKQGKLEDQVEKLREDLKSSIAANDAQAAEAIQKSLEEKFLELEKNAAKGAADTASLEGGRMREE